MSVEEVFFAWLAGEKAPRVLELGTKGWHGQPPRHHRGKVLVANPSAIWTGADAEAGDGVDVVADAHRLGERFPADSFDAVICVSTLEHLARPWVAAVEMGKVVRPGGGGLVATHQSFPVHGYPNDYFRFTVEGLRELFRPEIGWEIEIADYSHPCCVVPKTNCLEPGQQWNFEAPAYLNVAAFLRRLP